MSINGEYRIQDNNHITLNPPIIHPEIEKIIAKRDLQDTVDALKETRCFMKSMVHISELVANHEGYNLYSELYDDNYYEIHIKDLNAPDYYNRTETIVKLSPTAIEITKDEYFEGHLKASNSIIFRGKQGMFFARLFDEFASNFKEYKL